MAEKAPPMLKTVEKHPTKMAELKITKHNELVETSYKLGAREQFFVLFLIANLSTRDADFPQYRLPFSRIMKLMNFDGRRRIANVKDLEKMMDNLNTAPIKFVDGDEDVKVAWITELRYNRKTKEVAFTLNPNLKRYLLNLKGFFTNYNIWNIVYLSSHSIRLYELLKRHEYHKEHGIIFKVDYLKNLLGIEDKYPEFYEFKRWVLQSAQEELERYTDIRFLCSEHEKEGKRVISLKFEIFENEPHGRPETLQLLEKIRLNDSEKPYELAALESPVVSRRASARGSAQLTPARQRAFDFLVENGVNEAFVLNKIFAHPKLAYSELAGFEDVYFQTLWQFFKGKSTAQSKAGAFVSWWKNEKFTNDQNHARFVEAVVLQKKKMRPDELDARRAPAGDMPPPPDAPPTKAQQGLQEALAAFSAAAQQQPIPRAGRFDMEQFKRERPEVYAQQRDRAEQAYRAFYEEVGARFDAVALAANIEAKTREACEAWLRENPEKIA